MAVTSLELAQQQVSNHLTAGDPSRPPQRWEVERRAQAIGEAKEQHWRDPAPSVLEGEAALRHLVLLHGATVQVVHGTRRVNLREVLAWCVCPLLARQDVEIVISRVAAGMALRADSRAEDDEIFSDT
jgi:hypothetical protein